MIALSSSAIFPPTPVHSSGSRTLKLPRLTSLSTDSKALASKPLSFTLRSLTQPFLPAMSSSHGKDPCQQSTRGPFQSELMHRLGEFHDALFQASLCVFGNTEMCFNSQLVLPQPDQDEIDEGDQDSACDD